MTTKAAALKLYAKACDSHRRQDWREACHAMAQALGTAPAPARAPARPESLVHFLAKTGLSDEGGEVRARDCEIWHKGAPFRRRLVREGGRSLEAAAEAAHDAGYFPEVAHATMDSDDNMQPVTGDHLLRAIERELSGQPIYADKDRDAGYLAALETDGWEPDHAGN